MSKRQYHYQLKPSRRSIQCMSMSVGWGPDVHTLDRCKLYLLFADCRTFLPVKREKSKEKRCRWRPKLQVHPSESIGTVIELVKVFGRQQSGRIFCPIWLATRASCRRCPPSIFSHELTLYFELLVAQVEGCGFLFLNEGTLPSSPYVSWMRSPKPCIVLTSQRWI